MENIVIAADHAGKALKDFIKNNLKTVTIEDLGTKLSESVDYPDFAAKACEAILEKRATKAILVCGSGIGMSMAANKFPGIRAAHVESSFTARLAGEHNQANILCIGERVSAPHYALEMVQAWLGAEFGGADADTAAKSRHERRIAKIHELEKNS